MPTAATITSPVEELLADYRRYVRIERVWRNTIVIYVPAARLFLAGRERPAGWGWSGCRRRT